MPQYINRTVQGYSKITGVTPSNTLPVPPGTKALYVEGTGNVTVQMPGAPSTFTYTAVPAGTWLPIAPEKVMATGTSATNINAMG
jgi:hypothetical protein